MLSLPPLTGTSANLAGLEACTTAADVQIHLGDRIPLIIDGGDLGGQMAKSEIHFLTIYDEQDYNSPKTPQKQPPL